MNPNYTDFRFPQIRAHPWNSVFRPTTPREAINVISQMLVYTPHKRIAPLAICAHEFFDSLRDPELVVQGVDQNPPLFDFTDKELA